MALGDLTNRARILVLCANPWDMTSEGGERGVTVEYLMWGEGGEVLAPQSEWNPLKFVGVRRGKCSMAPDFREKLVIAPAIYEAEFYLDINSKGQQIQKLRDIAYYSNVKFESYDLPGIMIPGMIQKEQKTELKPELKTEGKK